MNKLFILVILTLLIIIGSNNVLAYDGNNTYAESTSGNLQNGAYGYDKDYSTYSNTSADTGETKSGATLMNFSANSSYDLNVNLKWGAMVNATGSSSHVHVSCLNLSSGSNVVLTTYTVGAGVSNNYTTEVNVNDNCLGLNHTRILITTDAVGGAGKADTRFFEANLSETHYTFTGGLSPTCSVLYGSLTGDYYYKKGNSSTEIITCELEGYSMLNESYSVLDGSAEFTMVSKKVNISFLNWSGDYNQTIGYYTDLNNSVQFNTNNLSIPLINLSIGKVYIYYGWNNSIFNYSQFYEFENTQTNVISENITLLEKRDVIKWFRVLDESGRPIEGALIRLSLSKPSGDYKEIGQRFTDKNGYIYFYVDSDKDVIYRISKDGYIAIEGKDLDPNDGNYITYSSPKNVFMNRNTINTYKYVTITLYNTWYHPLNTTSIGISVYSPNGATITYSTNYRTGNYSLCSLNVFKQCKGYLIAGTDYWNTNVTTDLTIDFYVDGENWGNITIKNTFKDTGRFNEPSGLDSGTKKFLAWIGVILFSGILALLIQGEGEGRGEGKKGKTIFFSGILLLNVIFPLILMPLLIIVGLYYGLTYLRRVIGE